MGYIQDAHTLIGDLQASLQRLLERAVGDGAYGEIAEIAGLADAITKLTGDKRPAVPRNSLEPQPEVAVPISTKSPTRRRSGREEYPRFERDGDKLVKIGWSKRDGRAYEHRAPREVVDLVTAALSKIKSREVFNMDRVFPLNDNSGNEVPSYQVYLVVAWLRTLDVVRRRGKEGYTVNGAALEVSKLQRLWDATPLRD